MPITFTKHAELTHSRLYYIDLTPSYHKFCPITREIFRTSLFLGASNLLFQTICHFVAHQSYFSAANELLEFTGTLNLEAKTPVIIKKVSFPSNYLTG
jgi:hypothetical protein